MMNTKNQIQLQSDNPANATLGLVIYYDHHKQNKWTNATTPHLIQSIIDSYNTVIIESQADYERYIDKLDVVISMEPDWAGPKLNYLANQRCRERFLRIPSYILLSDFHDKKWRMDYVNDNCIDYILSYYHNPFLHHFTKVDSSKMIHFPWTVPDHWFIDEPIKYRGDNHICCFGGKNSPAYELRNWCREFDFVKSSYNSGCENAVMSDDEFVEWLRRQDAVIAAGSEDIKYRLTTPKYFETAGVGSLLFAQRTDDLDLLGFKHLENCIIFDKSNFEQLAREYLANPDNYVQIRENGRKLIYDRHRLSVRMGFLREHILKAIAGKQNQRVEAAIGNDLKAALRERNEQIKDTRREVVFIVDSPNWAHDYKTENIKRYLGGEYNIRKVFQKDLKAEDIQKADLVIVYYWSQFTKPDMKPFIELFHKNRHKILLGICSRYEMREQVRQEAMQYVNNLCSGVFVNNLAQFKEFNEILDVPVFHTPNGVDTHHFIPSGKATHREKLVVGWAGSTTNHGSKRGYHEFIVPAVKGVEGVELVVAAREEKWRSHQEMVEFYHSIDVYICASSSEGTPNPCLEAAGCGVPVITTRVGNMPELIRHGVNGFFIERNIDDIQSKLEMLKNNPKLVSRLGENIRKDILDWDWKRKAQNYRYIIEAGLTNAANSENLFKSPSQVYLASADRMDKVLSNVSVLKQLPDRKVDTYATVVGGLSGLNYLLSLEPADIVFYDVNISAVDYAKFIVELINISSSHDDFITRVFCRSVKNFEAQRGKLRVENQDEYLKIPIDNGVMADTINRLSRKSSGVFKDYILPHLQKGILDGVRNCRFLLPCFPINERVPVGGGLEMGRNQHGKDVPNTNSFFYGFGWLESQAAFEHVQRSLAKAKLSFVCMDILTEDIEPVCDMSGSLVLHASNIDDWFPEQWVEFVDNMVTGNLNRQGQTAFVTTNGSVQIAAIDAHEKAYKAIEPYVYGNIVEVTHKTPWGFHEFDRQNILYSDYLKSDYAADTTILHILSGEGLGVDVLRQVLKKSLSVSNRVIVMEHNGESIDWQNSKDGSLLNSSQLKSEILPLLREGSFDLTSVVDIAGEKDLKRNIMFVADKESQVICSNTAQPVEAVLSQRPRSSGSSSIELSVVITAYNRPELLDMVMDGFTRQKAAKDIYEVIVVDASEPSLEHIAKKYESVINVVYVYERGCGLSEARNLGIRAAKGEFVLFSDDDDIPSADLISEHLRSHRENPDERIAVLGHLEWHPDLKVTAFMHYVTGPGGEYFGYSKMQDGECYNAWKWWGGLISAKKSLLDRVGPFDENLRFGYEDTELVCRMLFKSVKVLYNAKAKSFIVRPTDFDDFCKRRYEQGKALHYVAQKHPALIVPRYDLSNAEAIYNSRKELAEKCRAMVPAAELLVQDVDYLRPEYQETVKSLFEVYRICLLVDWLKGYLDQKKLVEDGKASVNDPVNAEPVPTNSESEADYNIPYVRNDQRRLKITLISTHLPAPDIGSSNHRIYQLLKIMEAAGHTIDYIYIWQYEKDEQYKAEFGSNVNFMRFSPEGKPFTGYFNSKGEHEIDCVWVTNLWTIEYLQFCGLLIEWIKEKYPQMKVILDTMDLHYKKWIRKYEISKASEDLDRANRFLQLEKQFYPIADETVVVTENEKKGILEQVHSGIKVDVIPNIHKMANKPEPVTQRQHICFLGTFKVNHNRDAVLWFLKEVFPLILRQRPDVEFHLMGVAGEKYKELFSGYDNVKMIGYVEDADAAMSKYRLFVCPMTYGAGMKGKIGIAAANGTPVVMTSIGAEGFEFTDGKNSYIADDPGVFAERCLSLLQDDKLWEQFSQEACKAVGDQCSIRTASKILPSVLSPIGERQSNAGNYEPATPKKKTAAVNIAKSNKPRVTVITACHNAQKYLPECVESVRSQTMSDFELILLDDASTDNTSELINGYAKHDNRIKAYCFDDNKGPYERRNFAIERAQGEFIVVHDGDDIMAEDKLEKLYNLMVSDDRLAIAGSFYCLFYKEFKSFDYCDRIILPVDHEELQQAFYTRHHVISLGTSMIRKSMFDIIGNFGTNKVASDRYWFTKLGYYTQYHPEVRIANVPEYLTYLRIHGSSQTQTESTYDPRGARQRFKDYFTLKLRKIEERFLNDRSFDFDGELKKCDCSDFKEKFADDITQWADQKLDESYIKGMIKNAVMVFNAGYYVTCIDLLNNIEKMRPEVPDQYMNFHMLRGMVLLSLDMRQKGIEELTQELQKYDNPAARKFMTDYFRGLIKGPIRDWCEENAKRFELQITDTTKSKESELVCQNV